jgi:dUTP pyrophosphatase
VGEMNYKLVMLDAIEPTRKHPEDAGMDVYAYGDYIIRPHTIKIVRTGISVDTPKRYMTLIKPKSRSNFLIGGGVVDEGYTGEVLVKIFNVLDEDIVIRHGDPVAQLINVKIVSNPPNLTDVVTITGRGDTGGIVTQRNSIPGIDQHDPTESR